LLKTKDTSHIHRFVLHKKKIKDSSHKLFISLRWAEKMAANEIYFSVALFNQQLLTVQASVTNIV